MATKNVVVRYAAKEEGGFPVSFRVPMTEGQLKKLKRDIRKGLIRNCSVRAGR